VWSGGEVDDAELLSLPTLVAAVSMKRAIVEHEAKVAAAAATLNN
jgi:hypothetical protein